jgi:hypothetical protein
MIAIPVGLLLLVATPVLVRRAFSQSSGMPDRFVVVRALAAPPMQAWAEAMRAEHAAIADPGERRRFARGCLWAILLGAMPIDRTGRLMRVTVAVLLGAAGGLAVFGLLRYPGLRSGWWVVFVAAFVTLLIGYGAAGRLVAACGQPQARRLGLLAGLPAAALVASGLTTDAAVTVPIPWLILLLPAFAAWMATRGGRAAAGGIVAALSCVVAAGLLTFVTGAAIIYAAGGGPSSPGLVAEYHRSGFHDYTTWAIGDALGGAVFLLGLVLLVGTAAGGTVALLRGHGPTQAKPARTTYESIVGHRATP